MKSVNCDCEWRGKEALRVCLYHYTWLQLLEEARPVMAGNETWAKLAGDLPYLGDFPLTKAIV